MSNPVPDWNLIITAGLGTVGLYLGVVLLCKVATYISNLRYDLRDRYIHDRWRPGTINLVLIPSWLMLEVLCVVCGLIFAVMVGLAAMALANSARDWWHAGDRSK